MDKSIFLFLFSFLLFTSCGVQKNYNVNEFVITIGEDNFDENYVDTNLYNTYYVTYKNGETQRFSYEYRYSLFNVIDKNDVINIDTLQNKVLWVDLY
jgi:hypothetical protein